MKVRLIFLCPLLLLLLLSEPNAFGQRKSDQFINGLVGKWSALDSSNYTIEIKRETGVLLITETTAGAANKPYIAESRIYLDGRVQKDGLKQSATEARTVIKDSSLTTTFYGVKDGGVKTLFKERLSVKNGDLVRAVQIGIGIPFLAAGTKQVFQRITN